MVNQEELKRILVSELNYTKAETKAVISEVAELEPQIQGALVQWMETRKLPDLEIQGFTVDFLMQISDCTPISALLTLDWLLKEPKVALAAIKEGCDRIL